MQTDYRQADDRKKGPVSAKCLLKSTMIVTVKAMEFIQANMTTVVVNIVVSINTN